MGSITEPYSIILPARCLNLPKNSIHFLVKSSWGSELNSKIQDAFGWESRHWKDWAMFRSMHYNARRTNMGTVFISKRFPLNYLKLCSTFDSDGFIMFHNLPENFNSLVDKNAWKHPWLRHHLAALIIEVPIEIPPIKLFKITFMLSRTQKMKLIKANWSP